MTTPEHVASGPSVLGSFLYGIGPTVLASLPLAMATPTQSPERNFNVIERELEKALLLLKNTVQPKPRREILRELRLLLEEADAVIATAKE